MSEPVRAADTTSDGTEPDPGRWWALVVLAAAQLMIILDASIVNIALPVGAGGPRHQQRRPAVDGDGVHAGLRCAAAAGWADRRLHRPQAHLHHRPDRVRRRLGDRWTRAQPGAAVRRTRPPGCLRGSDGARCPVHRDGHVHRAEGARQGVRRVRCAGRRRCRDRPDRRRPAHGVRLVALVPRRQRAGGPDRGGGGGPARQGEQGARRHPVRHPGRPARHGRAVLAGLRLHRGRPGREPGRSRSPWPCRAGPTRAR